MMTGTLLADQLQITKQSVNDLLRHLEQHGYITRQHDPTDGRARIVRLTPKDVGSTQLSDTKPGQPNCKLPICSDPAGSSRCTMRSKCSPTASVGMRCPPRCSSDGRTAVEGTSRGWPTAASCSLRRAGWPRPHHDHASSMIARHSDNLAKSLDELRPF